MTDLITAKQAVLAQLKTALNGADATEDTPEIVSLGLKPLQTALTKAQSDWDEPGRLPRGVGEHQGVDIDALVQDWLATQAAVEAHIQTLKTAAQQARAHHALALAQALDAGVDSAVVLALWDTASKEALIKKAFASRVTAFQNSTDTTLVGDATALEQALLDAEIASQTDSPAAHKEARLALQVQRLSDKLTGAKQHHPDAGFSAWLTALALPGSTQGEAGQRIAAMAVQL
jgi:hypothetical protein